MVEDFVFQEAEYQLVELDKMNPAPYNPRYDLQPGDREYDGLRASIMKNGLLQPIVWNKRTGTIVGGHQRYKVLKELGAKAVICAVVDKSPEDEMAANFALNKAQGHFENQLLAKMFEQMEQEQIDYQAIGYNEEEINHIMSGLEQLNEDDIFDYSMEPDKKPLMVTCPCCGKKFEERENRVSGSGIEEPATEPEDPEDE